MRCQRRKQGDGTASHDNLPDIEITARIAPEPVWGDEVTGQDWIGTAEPRRDLAVRIADSYARHGIVAGRRTLAGFVVHTA